MSQRRQERTPVSLLRSFTGSVCGTSAIRNAILPLAGSPVLPLPFPPLNSFVEWTRRRGNPSQDGDVGAPMTTLTRTLTTVSFALFGVVCTVAGCTAYSASDEARHEFPSAPNDDAGVAGDGNRTNGDLAEKNPIDHVAP